MPGPMKLFTFCPDEFYDCGGLGEHPVTFTAWIDEDEIGSRTYKTVNITLATIEFRFGSQIQVLDITKKVKDSSYTREIWEEKIYASYCSIRQRKWEEGA